MMPALSDLGTAVGNRLGRRGAAVGLIGPMYASCLRAVYRRQGLPWRVNGEPLRIDPDVRRFVPRENERPLFDYLRSGIRPGDLVFDVGAFLGAYAVMEARWAGARGRVVAFEPSPWSFGVLFRHLRMNGLGPDRVDARRAAMGARVGRQGLVTFEDEPYRDMIAPDVTVKATTTVETVTIDDVARELGRAPDWIRMDVQGLEFDVLEGARRVLAEARGRVRIVAEMHPDQWLDLGIDPGDAHRRFAALGLRARPLTAAEPLFTQSGHAIIEPL